jgi:hypothetical protein
MCSENDKKRVGVREDVRGVEWIRAKQVFQCPSSPHHTATRSRGSCTHAYLRLELRSAYERPCFSVFTEFSREEQFMRFDLMWYQATRGGGDVAHVGDVTIVGHRGETVSKHASMRQVRNKSVSNKRGKYQQLCMRNAAKLVPLVCDTHGWMCDDIHELIAVAAKSEARFERFDANWAARDFISSWTQRLVCTLMRETALIWLARYSSFKTTPFRAAGSDRRRIHPDLKMWTLSEMMRE